MQCKKFLQLKIQYVTMKMAVHIGECNCCNFFNLIGGIQMKKMTDAEKHQQILKEMKATLILFAIVAAWHIGTAFALNGIDFLVFGMPLWFFVSTIGALVISVTGVAILLKNVFVNFDLGEEASDEAEKGGTQS